MSSNRAWSVRQKSKTANGAHFLIAKDGQIYQTASIYRVTWHVGKSQSRCFLKHKCSPAEFTKITQLEKSRAGKENVSRLEHKKPFPERFPFNTDSIGIEIVGFAYEKGEKEPVYEPVNQEQNDSLRWLVKQLAETLNVSMSEIYRHP
ncbi:N-acetylmuramoyl-L-alanine amidase [Erwinia mallotivora]|uniref:N-acetylmuramoyl-L-alanine amidase n=1 Tax=Erwinia mallotivora TaxID=69222 RepID=UPI0035ED170F